MMICIQAHLFQVVVLSGYPQTFLGVGYTAVRNRLVPEEDIFKLVHPGIGKHEGWIILYDHGCGRNNVMMIVLKKIQESLPDLF